MKLAAWFLLFALNAFAADFTVIAHRGAPGYLPEHTLEGVAMAHAWGVDFIEPDLVMTKDDKLVIMHDHHVDTTTNVAQLFPNRARRDGRYYAIDFTLAELKLLNVHERVNTKTGKRVFPRRFPLNKSSFKIPTFEEFIELVQGLNKSTGRNVGIYPEIKHPEFHLKEGKDITAAAMKTLRSYGYENTKNAYIQCFYPGTLKRLKNEFKTNIPLIQLIADDSWGESSANYSKMLTKKGLKQVSAYADGVGPWIQQVMKRSRGKWTATGVVKNARRAGLKVHPYTHRLEELPQGLNEDQFFHFMKNVLNVDGIFSDFGDRAMKFK